jgi:hypothetical protein
MISVLMVTFCKKEPKNSGNNNQNSSSNLAKNVEMTLTIKVEKVKDMSIDSFVKVFLSRMEHEIKWTLQMQKYAKDHNILETDFNNENEKSKELLALKAKMEQDFYIAWGVNKESFEKFAQENELKIQKHIENNKDIQDFIDRIQDMHMKLYSMDEDMDKNESESKNSEDSTENEKN